MGVCLFVFVHPDHLAGVTDVAVDFCKTGAKGKAGNKGGVAVRFRLYEQSVCFVCAHLAAGQSHVADRNQGLTVIADSSLQCSTRFGFRLHGYLKED